MPVELRERTPEEIEADEIQHRKKREKLDEMRDKQQRKAERLEKIQPRTTPQPVLTVEELEAIEAELPKGDFTDNDIQKAIKKKGLDVQIQQRLEEVKKIKPVKPTQ